MSEIDKVLEAEQTIKDIANELKKMKNAADLLDDAQQKVDSVIETGETIIEKIGEFVDQGTEIVKKINEYDIQGDLTRLNTTNNENQILLKDITSSNRRTNKMLKILLGFIIGILIVCLVMVGLTII